MPYHELVIHAPARQHASVVNLVMRHGSLGITEQINKLIAYFPSSLDIKPLVTALKVLGMLLEPQAANQMVIEHKKIPDADWNQSWKKSFRPLSVGKRFSILPPWEKPPRGRIPLIIDPGMAFGTGHHETTRSCILLMEKYACTVPEGRFLDLGTGTGLLAMAAHHIGFRNVVGIDTDPLSIKAARRNRTLNKITGIVFRKGGIDSTRGLFNMIAANLIAGTLIELAAEIAHRTATTGIVIMSGILKGQDADVTLASKQAGLRLRERMRAGKWVSLVLER